MNATRPKRVLYVENGIGYGGAAICMRHLVRNLDRLRFEPIVVTGRTGPQYREIAQEATWHHLPDRYMDVVAMKEQLAKTAWVDGVPGLRLVFGQLLARLDDLVNFLPFFLRLLWLARRERIDIIHANNEPLCNRAALLVGKVLKRPVICHVRGNIDGSRLMHRLYQLPDHFIPVSHWVSQAIGGLDVPENKRTVIYDGLELDGLDVNADGGTFRREHGVPEDAFAVGLVGLIIDWKGQDLFLDTAATLREAIPNLRMLLVGGTPPDFRPYEAHLRKRVEREGLHDTVIFTGHVSDMPAVYNGLDVVLSASTEPEPLGTVVIESLIMARPLIVPDHGGGAEMVADGVTGLQFRHGDAESLAQAILRLHDDPTLRERLGGAARSHALDTFSVEHHVQAVQAVYEATLSSPDRRNST